MDQTITPQHIYICAGEVGVEKRLRSKQGRRTANKQKMVLGGKTGFCLMKRRKKPPPPTRREERNPPPPTKPMIIIINNRNPNHVHNHNNNRHQNWFAHCKFLSYNIAVFANSSCFYSSQTTIFLREAGFENARFCGLLGGFTNWEKWCTLLFHNLRN